VNDATLDPCGRTRRHFHSLNYQSLVKWMSRGDRARSPDMVRVPCRRSNVRARAPCAIVLAALCGRIDGEGFTAKTTITTDRGRFSATQ
jgi:hypothetical protein